MADFVVAVFVAEVSVVVLDAVAVLGAVAAVSAVVAVLASVLAALASVSVLFNWLAFWKILFHKESAPAWTCAIRGTSLLWLS
ncbi:hypothetical protein P4634_24425 [Neobacillus mesonae]|nr:hypothetical protein [Neobacillus mesonae]